MDDISYESYDKDNTTNREKDHNLQGENLEKRKVLKLKEKLILNNKRPVFRRSFEDEIDVMTLSTNFDFDYLWSVNVLKMKKLRPPTPNLLLPDIQEISLNKAKKKIQKKNSNFEIEYRKGKFLFNLRLFAETFKMEEFIRRRKRENERNFRNNKC